MKSLQIKDKTEIVLRKAQASDAENIVKFYNKIGGETDFLSFGKDEYPNDEKTQKTAIESTEKQQNSIMLLAVSNKEIVGIATLNSSQKRKMRHVGEFGIGITQKFCGLGLGTAMIKEIFDFAKSNKITQKITLVTRQDNRAAIELYKKLGFQTEGVLKKETFEKGEYFDSLYMTKFV